MSNVSSWNVGRAGGTCAACGASLPPGTECWAALCDRPLVVKTAAEAAAASKKKEEVVEVSPFLRIDFCEACWAAGKRPENLPAVSEGEAGEAVAAGEARGGGAGTGPLVMFSFWR